MTATVVRFPQPERQRSQQVTSWNADEEEALGGLPLEAQVIYLRVMRRHMDYATGIVGRVRRISYDQILERIDYHPPARSREKPRLHSRDQVKRLIQRLVDAGLLMRLHDTTQGVAPMEFFLPLADADGVPEEVSGAMNNDSNGETTPPRQNPHARASGEGNTATDASQNLRDDRHDSATVCAPRHNPRARASGEGDTATRPPRHERHPSGTSGIDSNESMISLGRAREVEPDEPQPKPKPAEPKSRPDAAIQSRDGKVWGTHDDLELAEWMAGQVDALPGGVERRDLADWANTLRLMRERDDRELIHIRALFRWANGNDFWQANIRSPRKLREQWKTLVLQRNRDYQRAKAQETNHANSRQRTPARRLTAAEARERDRERQQSEPGGNVFDGQCTPTGR